MGHLAANLFKKYPRKVGESGGAGGGLLFSYSIECVSKIESVLWLLLWTPRAPNVSLHSHAVSNESISGECDSWFCYLKLKIQCLLFKRPIKLQAKSITLPTKRPQVNVQHFQSIPKYLWGKSNRVLFSSKGEEIVSWEDRVKKMEEEERKISWGKWFPDWEKEDTRKRDIYLGL